MKLLVVVTCKSKHRIQQVEAKISLVANSGEDGPNARLSLSVKNFSMAEVKMEMNMFVKGWSIKVNISSYIAQYPVLRIAVSVLHFTSWQTCRYEHHLNFLGKHPAMLQLKARRLFLYKYPPLSTTRYPFVHLTELLQHRVNELDQGST